MENATLMMPTQPGIGVGIWQDPDVPGDPETTTLRDATERRILAVAALEEARAAERQAIADAAIAKVKQVEIVRITGYTREHVRRIVADVQRERDEA